MSNVTPIDKSHRCEINGAEYVICPHPTTEGIRFAALVVGAALAPIARLLDSAAKSGIIRQDAEWSADMLLSLLDHADVGELANDLRASLAELSPADYAMLFKYTMRDKQRLSMQAVFDSVYAGNWKEFYLATAKIIEVNHFLPF